MEPSEVDTALFNFRRIRHEQALLPEDTDWTESDTRSKFIDPIFKSVLGWYETDIRREVSLDSGYVDYLLGADYAWLHIEAKRTLPRFKLELDSQKLVQLSGAHLLGNPTVRTHIEQTAKYARDLGSDHAILTNGHQFIVFRTHQPGRSWKTGRAFIWPSLDCIEDNFALFYRLLSRQSVRSGYLSQAFEEAEDITTPLHSIASQLWNADAELIRNPFWARISQVITPLFTDDPNDRTTQHELIANCYVSTPISEQADRSLDSLLRDLPGTTLRHAGVVDITPASQGRDNFDHNIETDIKSTTISPKTYILTGGVGSGKTTFLRRFVQTVQHSFVKQFCIWLHVDFLATGDLSTDSAEADLRNYAQSSLREELQRVYPDLLPKKREDGHALFREEIERTRSASIFTTDADSEDALREFDRIADQCAKDNTTLVRALIRLARAKGLRPVIVLDNTDQMGERVQQSVFLLAQRLSKELSALTIVTLREEKFFAAFRRGAFDAFGDRRFHIGTPDLEKVLHRRLNYATSKLVATLRSAPDSTEKSDLEETIRFLRAITSSLTQQNKNIVRMLSCVSNGDMRYALGMFRDFLSSGNTDTEKILRILRRTRSYTVPFHEFAKSAILGTRRYFKSGVGHIVNVFQRSPARHSSHLTACRLLARLTSAEGSSSRYGPGYVETTTLLGEYRQSFGNADDFIQRANVLLSHGLLESEPPKIGAIERADALRISASGAYYWRYLIRSFAYLDLVFVDTRIADRELAARLAGMAQVADLGVRFERVRAFLDYLGDQERKELLEAFARGGPFTRPLIKEVSAQIESELEVISRKTGTSELR